MSETVRGLQANFYPQNGGADPRTLWYGDSSLLTDVKLWWADAQDDNGWIMVHSDNNPSDFPFGGCDNASRFVSYVVLMGQGYSSNPLLDMRIHDINVEADINRRVPTIPEPGYADATLAGHSDSEVVEAEQEFTLDFLGLMTATWELVNWWPRLFLRFAQTLDSIFDIELSYDLTGNVEMHKFSVISEAEQQCTETEINDALQQYDLSPEHMFWLAVSIGLEVALIASMKALRVATWGMAWYGAAVLVWFAAFIIWITILNDLVKMGTSHAIEVVAMLLSFMIFLFPDSIAKIISGFGVIGDERLLSLCSGMLGDMDQMLGMRNFLLGIIEFLVILICAYYFAKWLSLCIFIGLQWLGSVLG